MIAPALRGRSRRSAERSLAPLRRRRDRTRRLERIGAVVLSLVVHGLLAAGSLLWRPEPPPLERKIELALVRPGRGDEQGVPPPSPEPAAVPEPPSRPATPRRTATAPARAVPPAPGPSAIPLPSPAPTPAPPAPRRSFRDWQRSKASSFLPTREPIGEGGAEGQDLAQVRGRDRCEPPEHRDFDVLFLLFDASGSMSDMGRAQALSCGHQYAKAAIERGAPVIVGTFARTAVFSPPTRRLMDVQAALRTAVDATATILPTRELQPLLDTAPGAVAELVVVSDGWFVADDEVLVWYRYFLEANRENRATMYTVGVQGQRDAVRRLQGVGFDVFVYDQLR